MSRQTLEGRVAELERRVAELTAQLSSRPKKDWIHALIESGGAPGLDSIFEEGRKVREADRAKARKAAARTGAHSAARKTSHKRPQRAKT